jgi:3-oxoacyl-[acyl-carrier protein] reductase
MAPAITPLEGDARFPDKDAGSKGVEAMTGKGTLDGRKALVTGGSRGIGAAIVRRFAAEGADVALVHLGDGDNARRLAGLLEEQGRTTLALECDVADPAAVAVIIGKVEDVLGGVDILVNCAGVVDQTPFAEITVAHWDRMIAVHLRGTFLMAHAVWPGMLQRGFGRIINFASQVAYKGMAGLTHYCAAKAGIIGLTRALALEGARYGVTVNAIAPGPTDTDILLGMPPDWRAKKMAELPIGRFATPDEIAPTALLLASDDGAFYLGQTLSPNGGDVML